MNGFFWLGVRKNRVPYLEMPKHPDAPAFRNSTNTVFLVCEYCRPPHVCPRESTKYVTICVESLMAFLSPGPKSSFFKHLTSCPRGTSQNKSDLKMQNNVSHSKFGGSTRTLVFRGQTVRGWSLITVGVRGLHAAVVVRAVGLQLLTARVDQVQRTVRVGYAPGAPSPNRKEIVPPTPRRAIPTEEKCPFPGGSRSQPGSSLQTSQRRQRSIPFAFDLSQLTRRGGTRPRGGG